jgi:NhaP-type Na+/H+ or K+/H+ antiporter
MLAIAIYAILLIAAGLLSDLFGRSVLSSAVLFLVTGIVGASLGLLKVRPQDTVVVHLADLALVAVLFTDAMESGVGDLARAWRLPGRALLLGLPLTLGGAAVLAHWIAGLTWGHSILIGAVLSPTDPVFAAAIVGSKIIPERLRGLLNVESGLNDGLAAPIVVLALRFLRGGGDPATSLAWQLPLGILIGVAVPWLAIKIEQSRFFAADALYRPLLAFAIGMSVWAICEMTGSNQFLGCFAAGVTVATLSPSLRDDFHAFGRQVSELLKLAALLVFGALISWSTLREIGWGGYAFVFLSLFLVRPAALGIALLGSPLDMRERITAAWFGPKGFASVVFGLLILEAGEPHAEYLFQLVWLVVTASIVLHSSSDVPIARWFERSEDSAAAGEDAGFSAKTRSAPEQ